MEYERYKTLTLSRNIIHNEDKYFVNEFKTIKHNGTVYLMQGYKYVGDNVVKWCKFGELDFKKIERIMMEHIESYYILDGEIIEVEDNWS